MIRPSRAYGGSADGCRGRPAWGRRIEKWDPLVLAFVFIAGKVSLEGLGLLGLIGIAFVAIYGGTFGRLRWLDHKENQAIRAGSQEAFDKRVEDYIQIFGYSREKAIETTERIKAGRRSRMYRIRIK